MATLKERVYRKNASGTYDTVHYESESSLIMRPNGRTVEQDLSDFLPVVQDNDNVPESLHFGTFSIGPNKIYAGQQNTVSRLITNRDNPLIYDEEKNLPPYEGIDADTLDGHDSTYFATSTDLDLVKTSVSEGKSLIAAAVTDKGVETAADDTFAKMADNIEKIQVGIAPYIIMGNDSVAWIEWRMDSGILSEYHRYAIGTKRSTKYYYLYLTESVRLIDYVSNTTVAVNSNYQMLQNGNSETLINYCKEGYKEYLSSPTNGSFSFQLTKETDNVYRFYWKSESYTHPRLILSIVE